MGEGPAIVILHGLFGSSDNWATFGKQLAGLGFSVYLVDQRNHGKSLHSDVFDYYAMADDLHELLEQEQPDRPVILGHSMGGKTAMTFCRRYPGKAHGLVVVDIAPRYYKPHHIDIIDALLHADPSSRSSRKEAEAMLGERIADPSVVQFLAKNLFWDEHQKLNWRFNLAAIQRNIEEVGAAIADSPPLSVPALFVRGEKSGYITQEDEVQITRMFPNSEIRTVPGAGHWVHADNPGYLLELLLGFLSGVAEGK